MGRCCVSAIFVLGISASPVLSQITFVDSAARAMKDAAAPADYIIRKLAEYRIVLVGEPHWLAQDVALVKSVVARLPDAGVSTLAVEWTRASEQGAWEHCCVARMGRLGQMERRMLCSC
jgi:hypothetical protein